VCVLNPSLALIFISLILQTSHSLLLNLTTTAHPFKSRIVSINSSLVNSSPLKSISPILLSRTLNSCKMNFDQTTDRHNQICNIVCQAINIHEKIEGEGGNKLENFIINYSAANE
jgi:hypothetical protein